MNINCLVPGDLVRFKDFPSETAVAVQVYEVIDGTVVDLLDQSVTYLQAHRIEAFEVVNAA